MRKLFIILSLSWSYVLQAQEINGHDPYIYKDVLVTDTAKCMDKVKAFNEECCAPFIKLKDELERKEAILDSLIEFPSAYVADYMSHSGYIRTKEFKNYKIETLEAQELVKEVFNEIGSGFDCESNVKNSKFNKKVGLMLFTYRKILDEKLENAKKGIVVRPWTIFKDDSDCQKTVQEKTVNKNYRGYVRYDKADILDRPQIIKGWEWLDDEYEDVSIHYPLELDYSKFNAHPEYYVLRRNEVYDKDGNIVAIGFISSEHIKNLEDEVLNALYIKDYRNNKYDISKEGQNTQLTIKDKLGILSKSEDANQTKALKGGLAQMVVAGEAQHKAKVEKNYNASKKAEMAGVNAYYKIAKEMSKYEDEKGKQYIRQLQDDHGGTLYFIYKISRIDNTSFHVTYCSDKKSITEGIIIKYVQNGKFKVKETIVLDKPEENLEPIIVL